MPAEAAAGQPPGAPAGATARTVPTMSRSTPTPTDPRPGDPDGPGVVAVIPAAGRARRLGPLPCSKEILPLAVDEAAAGDRPVRVACHGLLDRLYAGGARRALVVVGTDKWDIPRYLGPAYTPPAADPAAGELALAYVPAPASSSVPETLARALPFVGDSVVALGWPDVLFEPADAFARLLRRRAATGADVALGLFPTDRPWRTDMVDAGAGGEVRAIEVRPATSRLAHNWLIAAWTPRFGRFLGRRVASSGGDGGELQLGEVFRGALESGLSFTAEVFRRGRFLDVGTPADLAVAWRSVALHRVPVDGTVDALADPRRETRSDENEAV